MRENQVRHESASWPPWMLGAAVAAMVLATVVNVTSEVGALFLITPVGGLMLGILLVVPRRQLLLAAVLLALTTGAVYLATAPDPADDLVFALAVVSGQVAVLVPTALVLRRHRAWVDGTREPVGAWLWFLLLGVVGASAADALLHAVAKVALDVGPVPWDVFWSRTLVNLLTFAIAKLLLVPAILRLRPAHLQQRPQHWPGLAGALVLVAALTALLMSQHQAVLLFLIPIPLCVIVVRHAAVGATLGALVVAPVVLAFTGHGVGPFVTAAGTNVDSALVIAQVFLALTAAASLVLVATLDERDGSQAHLFESLRREAMTDGLTGVANRRHFQQELSAAWHAAAKSHEPLSLLLIDVDHFKRYNDDNGHPAGDRALIAVTSAIGSALLRPSDLPARYGGEEFVVLLPHTDAAGAQHVAEAVRSAVADLAVAHPSTPAGQLTVSIGFATAHPRAAGAGQDRLLADADAALYRAKDRGRNRAEGADLA